MYIFKGILILTEFGKLGKFAKFDSKIRQIRQINLPRSVWTLQKLNCLNVVQHNTILGCVLVHSREQFKDLLFEFFTFWVVCVRRSSKFNLTGCQIWQSAKLHDWFCYLIFGLIPYFSCICSVLSFKLFYTSAHIQWTECRTKSTIHVIRQPVKFEGLSNRNWKNTPPIEFFWNFSWVGNLGKFA